MRRFRRKFDQHRRHDRFFGGAYHAQPLAVHGQSLPCRVAVMVCRCARHRRRTRARRKTSTATSPAQSCSRQAACSATRARAGLAKGRIELHAVVLPAPALHQQLGARRQSSPPICNRSTRRPPRRKAARQQVAGEASRSPRARPDEERGRRQTCRPARSATDPRVRPPAKVPAR